MAVRVCGNQLLERLMSLSPKSQVTCSQAVRRSRAVHACGALRLVGGCTRRHNNVGGVTAGRAPHNSCNVGVVTAVQVGHNSSFINYPTNVLSKYANMCRNFFQHFLQATYCFSSTLQTIVMFTHKPASALTRAEEFADAAIRSV